ncbi:MAG: hypothetical protein ABFC67_12510 [Mizugakiibacter sp.]|uniref:hypothetical protein n=1 Tax=Mizugakiibacter sp. TaxID=1972610 RepID=UPI0031CA1AFC|nr:hypothetical protein [Xanthomonadaceae bacterium]
MRLRRQGGRAIADDATIGDAGSGSCALPDASPRARAPLRFGRAAPRRGRKPPDFPAHARPDRLRVAPAAKAAG